ncbi:hypothetical protein Q8F55_001623 [Vanrija albida]|uniref:Methyltransferase domain-containing protein n=1 Tax=Vanrija albida TaxID=181172 RepID=A0ABR3QGH8_9TREE
MPPTAIPTPTPVAASKAVAGLHLVPGTESRQYHSTKESIYALPADGQEYDRLEQQHRLIMLLFDGPVAIPSVRDSLTTTGGKVLDIGSGPGSWIKDVKKAFPKAECHATDFVADTFKPTEANDIAFVVGNVLTGLPYPDNAFDFVHMRFFTGALKKSEWPIAVNELVRVTKPGGWIQMVEPDGRIRSERGITPTIEDWNTRGMRGSLLKRGGEPNAGPTLATFLSNAGLAHIEDIVASAPMNSKAGSIGEHMVKDYRSLITTLAPILSQSWDITPDAVVEWGFSVIAQSEALEGFHNFHTAFGQKP